VTPVTNHRAAVTSISVTEQPRQLLFFGQSCTFLDNSVAASQDHLFDRAKWWNATAMPKQKKSRAEIAKKLAQANRLARQGKLQSEIARTLGVSVMTLHRWRKALLGDRPAHEADQQDRIAQLQFENSLLRRLVTDLLLLEKIKRRHQRAVGGPSTD
jgi:putative transposase